eukprot:m.18725 g.18725  ORF g.18725 m.18725 type:complete len:75 (-) comp3693_c0_seq2:197-421(-)
MREECSIFYLWLMLTAGARMQVKPGGIVAGDDYYENFGEWWEGGVVKAVDEFVAEGKADVVLIDATQFVLRKRA